MKDGYNREISYMRLSITDRCNFKCKYCMPHVHSHNNSLLTLDEMYDICECAVDMGIKIIRITGGEPLVREGVEDFCKRVSSINNLEELTLTTNGSLLSEKAKALKNAGVSRINISLDTLKPDRFLEITGTNKLKDVLSGIEKAKTLSFAQLKINVVLMDGFNTDEISDFVELTKEDNISVRFIELMPIGDYPDFNKRYVSADIVLKAEPSLKQVNFSGVAQVYKKDGYKGTVGLIRPISNSFCDVCNRIRVTADGKLKTCLHSCDEYDLRGLKGELLKDKFIEAILSKPDSHTLSETCFSNSLRYMNQIGG